MYSGGGVYSVKIVKQWDVEGHRDVDGLKPKGVEFADPIKTKGKAGSGQPAESNVKNVKLQDILRKMKDAEGHGV
jgi:hypothetical protein